MTKMPPMEVDRNGMQVLAPDECRRLLETATIGRVAVHSAALPLILPVNFLLTDLGILLRTSPGTKLANALENAVVAFEVDDFDAQRHAGWSVLVTGVARVLTEPAEVAHAKALPLAHWTMADADNYVSISLDLVSGRRILPKGSVRDFGPDPSRLTALPIVTAR